MSLQFAVQAIHGTPTALLTELVGTPQDELALDGLYHHHSFQPGMPWLVDNRGLARVPTVIDVDRVVGALQRRAECVGPARIAVVASGPRVFGMARFLSVASEELPARLEAFHRVESALQWLAAGSQRQKAPSAWRRLLEEVA